MNFIGNKIELSDSETQFYYGDLSINKKQDYFLKVLKADDENVKYLHEILPLLIKEEQNHVLLPLGIFYRVPRIKFLFPKMTCDLYTYNRSNIMSVEDLVFTIINLLDAVDYLHSKCIIHCDLKAENIVVCPKKRKPVVIDLDYATLNEPIDNLRDDKFYGTIIAPEMISREWTNSIDFFSIGYVFRELCIGEHRGIAPCRYNLIAKFKHIYDAMTLYNPYERLGFTIEKRFHSYPIRSKLQSYTTGAVYSDNFMKQICCNVEKTEQHKSVVDLI